MFKKQQLAFLNDHFKFIKESKSLINLFSNSFVRPGIMEEFNKIIEPEKDIKKIVFVIGPPRTGKTYLTIGSILEIIQKYNLSPKEWWTSGVDSFNIAGINLFTSVRILLEKIISEGYKSKKIIFLDDLIGTCTIRSLGNFKKLKNFFFWEHKNSLASHLSCDSTLILTVRSVHFLILEKVLGIKILDNENLEKNIKIEALHLGLPETNGNLCYSSYEIMEIFINFVRYNHLWDQEDKDYAFMNMPLMLYLRELKATKSNKKYAASVLFQDDILSLMDINTIVESCNAIFKEDILNILSFNPDLSEEISYLSHIINHPRSLLGKLLKNIVDETKE